MKDSAYYLSQMVGPKTKRIVMAHISNECNTREKIRQTFEDVFSANNLSLDTIEINIHFTNTIGDDRLMKITVIGVGKN